MTDPRFWSRRVLLSFTRAEFQLLAALAPSHLAGDTLGLLERDSNEKRAMMEFYDSFVCTDSSLLKNPDKQYQQGYKNPVSKDDAALEERKIVSMDSPSSYFHSKLCIP